MIESVFHAASRSSLFIQNNKSSYQFRVALGSVAASKVEVIVLNRSNTGLEKEKKNRC